MPPLDLHMDVCNIVFILMEDDEMTKTLPLPQIAIGLVFDAIIAVIAIAVWLKTREFV